jgi:hypothetical protein
MSSAKNIDAARNYPGGKVKPAQRKAAVATPKRFGQSDIGRHPKVNGYTAKKPGDRRPGSLGGGMPMKVQRSAAQLRRGQLNFKNLAGTGSHKEAPVNGNGPLKGVADA